MSGVAVVPAFQHSFPPLGTGPDIVHPSVCLLAEVRDGTQARRGHTRETIQPRVRARFLLLSVTLAYFHFTVTGQRYCWAVGQ